MEFYSLTLGEVVLETGLLEGLIFFGPFKAGFTGTGERDYTRDKSTDAHWNVAKLLCPSSNGQLGTTFDAAKNFARYVNNPKTVALILNYIKQVEDVEGRGSLKSVVTKAFEKKIFETLNGVTMKPQVFIDNVITPLLKHLRLAIEAEKKGTSFYPRHTAKQIVEAFFCYQFNTQEDIWALMENLDDSIVDKAKLKASPPTTHYLEEKDLPQIAGKTELNLDDFFALTQAKFFNSLTPYTEEASLVNNGDTYFYDREQDCYVMNRTFQDCVETSIRHLLNLILFNPLTREFDIAPITSFIMKQQEETGLHNPYFENFKKFYELQTVRSANAGDIGTRSLWNKVVADLPSTGYRQNNSNEIKSGFVNLMKTMNTVFGLSPDVPTMMSSGEKKMWVEESLTTLLSLLNPSHVYKIFFSESEVENIVFEDANIIVQNVEGTENLFSFTLKAAHSDDRGHTKITDLNILKTQVLPNYNKVLEQHAHILEKGTAEESFLLLAPTHLRKNIHPFYQLYSRPLSDNLSKIAFLQTLNDNYKSWRRIYPSFENNLSVIQSMTQNVIQGIGWEDYEARKIGLPILFHLSSFKGFQSAFSSKQLENLEKLLFLDDPLGSMVNLEEVVPNLRTLELSRTPNLKDFSLEKLENLETLRVVQTGLRNVKLHALNVLQTFLCTNNNYLENLSLEDLEQLKMVEIMQNGWASDADCNIEIKNLPQLTKANLYNTRNLFELTFENLPELKELYLGNTGVQKISDLNQLSRLEILDLSGVELEDTELSLNLSHLRELDLDSARFTKLTLQNMQNLENLNLRSSRAIQSITIDQDMKDLKLNLYRSGIKDRSQIIGIEHLDEANIRW